MTKLTDDNSPQFPEPGLPAPRHPVLDYFPEIGNRLTRFLTSRVKMVEGLKTLAWVVLFTALIWIYAEREQIVVPTSPNATGVAINIMSSDPSRYVDSPDQAPTVNLILTGPQQAVDRVRNLLIMRIPHEKQTIDIKSRGFGTQSVNIVQGLQDLAIFKDNGVTVQQSQPPELSVNVYKMGQRVLAVQIPPTVNNLTSETHFTPANVTVSGPEGLLTGDLKVYAKLEDYQQLQAGPHVIKDLPLEFIPPQAKLSISPSQVTADAVVVVASDVPYEITDAIPVRFSVQGIAYSSLIIEPPDGVYRVPHIYVKGPQAGIDAIKNKTFKVEATLKIERADAGSTVSKPLEYTLPPGVYATDENHPYEVHVTLRPQ